MCSKKLTYDIHVHTRFSPDSEVPFQDYAEAGQRLSCHVGFLDHYELAFLNRPHYLNEAHFPQLLDEFDRIHARFPHTSLGLEVDYYSHLGAEVAEFCDQYQKDFDYFIGVVHTLEQKAITIPAEMNTLVRKMGLEGVLERYFHEIELAIRSQLFDGIGHIDVVMRFIPCYPNYHRIVDYWRTRTLELGRLCCKKRILVEANLGGLHFPWGQIHPSRELIKSLVEWGTCFFVGSDSHTLERFLNSVRQVQQMNEYLLQKEALQLPGPLRFTSKTS